jgi:hypothetical protein
MSIYLSLAEEGFQLPSTYTFYKLLTTLPFTLAIYLRTLPMGEKPCLSRKALLP